ASFYFIHLDASLRRSNNLPAGVGGEAWQVHGGGFYRMQKYLVAPAELPDELTWFKWEAYTTWLSGFGLMAVVYYLGAEVFLVDRDVLDLPAWLAVLISAASLGLGWLGYDALCRSRIGRDTGRLALALFAALVAAAFLFAQLFSGRAAYLHAGALIGTMMVGNVLFVIIPNQKVVVADLIAGRTPDPRLGAEAKQRSLHNNYLTLPVVFTMISNHYPMTFGTRWSWLIFAGVLVVGGLVRHWFNLGHAGRPRPLWLWPAAAAGTALIVALSLPRTSGSDGEALAAVGIAEVRPIIAERCAVCHSRTPAMDGFEVPPMGLTFDSAREIVAAAGPIHAQAVLSRAMPPGNLTGLTEEERAVLARWVEAGAPAE
ncbi:MAG TPA: urate hydroxylase PuuD, partial [Geminicoccaceae bacterium]